MGADKLSASVDGGKGVRVAILDTGCPQLPCFPDGLTMGPPGDALDENGHATEVSSILFGGHGVLGLCEWADPMYIKVLNDSGVGTVEMVSECIEEAVRRGADVINLSLGFMRTEKCPRKLKKACEMAYEAGIPVICAAGNDGGLVNWPAALESTICVGSAGENGLKTSFSSVGEVDFVAPGLNLEVLGKDGHLKRVSGTSYSAAIVTGMVVLLIPGIKASNNGVVDVKTVKYALRELSQDVDSIGWDERTGFGLISGQKYPQPVQMKIETGFFGRILCKIRSMFGFRA